MSRVTPTQAELSAAADWMLRLSEGPAGSAEHRAEHRAWQQWLAHSEGHRAAWQKVEQLQALLAQSAAYAGSSLRRAAPAAGRKRRREALGALLGLGVAGLFGGHWLLTTATPTQWLSTAPGERRSLTLADGGELLIGPDSRVGLREGLLLREIELDHGLCQVRSGHADPLHRPLRLSTAEGWVRPLGTRFTVNRTEPEHGTRVAVQEAAVEVGRPGEAQPALQLQQGQWLWLGPSGLQTVQTGGPSEDAWVRGQLVVLDESLRQVIAQLRRHTGLAIRCSAEVAERRVSGSFPLNQPAPVLASLADLLGLQLTPTDGGWLLQEPLARPASRPENPARQMLPG